MEVIAEAGLMKLEQKLPMVLVYMIWPGSAWRLLGQLGEGCRSANRRGGYPSDAYDDGFLLVLLPGQPGSKRQTGKATGDL